MNNHQTVQVFKALLKGPLSRHELSRVTNSCPTAVGRLLNVMRANGLIYVVGYTNDGDGRNRVKIYTIGEGEDAKPVRRTRTQAERSRKSYLKKKESKNTFTPKTTFVGGASLWQ